MNLVLLDLVEDACLLTGCIFTTAYLQGVFFTTAYLQGVFFTTAFLQRSPPFEHEEPICLKRNLSFVWSCLDFRHHKCLQCS